MSIDPQEVHRVARLARIRVDDAEAQRLAADLGRILTHVDALRAPELESAQELAPHLRDDLPPVRSEAAESVDPLADAPGSFAPDFREGFFVVPPLPALGGRDGGDTGGAAR